MQAKVSVRPGSYVLCAVRIKSLRQTLRVCKHTDKMIRYQGKRLIPILTAGDQESFCTTAIRHVPAEGGSIVQEEKITS